MSARDNTTWGASFGMNDRQRTALITLMGHDDWDDRLCADPRKWDLPENHRGRVAAPLLAAQVEHRTHRCHACPLYDPWCLAYAATNPDVPGVLAGLTEDERKKETA